MRAKAKQILLDYDEAQNIKAISFMLERYNVAQNMQQHGGSFVRLLGVALQSADVPNALKIKEAFADYWRQYGD